MVKFWCGATWNTCSVKAVTGRLRGKRERMGERTTPGGNAYLHDVLFMYPPWTLMILGGRESTLRMEEL